MTRATPWLLGLAVAVAVLATNRVDARREGVLAERNRILDSTLTADRRILHAKVVQLQRDSLARMHAEQVAADARAQAAAAKAKADQLAAQVRILSDSVVIIGARDTVAIPRPVIAEITQLRGTVDLQANALAADTLAIKRLEVELATARETIGAGATLSGHQDEKVATLEQQRPGWLHRMGSAVISAGTAAGCGAIGAVLAGPAGAAIGAAACVVLPKLAGS